MLKSRFLNKMWSEFFKREHYYWILKDNITTGFLKDNINNGICKRILTLDFKREYYPDF